MQSALLKLCCGFIFIESNCVNYIWKPDCGEFQTTVKSAALLYNSYLLGLFRCFTKTQSEACRAKERQLIHN